MGKKHYIVYNPVTYNLMESIGKCKTPIDLLSDITNKNAAKLGKNNYLGYLDFDTRKEKLGMVETFAIESYAIIYVANQVAKLDAGMGHHLEIRIFQKKKPSPDG